MPNGRLAVTVVDHRGERHVLSLHPNTVLAQVRRMLEKLLRVPASSIRIFFKGDELLRSRELAYYGIACDHAELHVDIVHSTDKPFVKPFANAVCDAPCQSLLSNVEALLGMGKVPRLAMDGTGGAYFLNSNPKSVVAVFKPADEEQCAPNNPRNMVGQMGSAGLRKGIPSGQGCLREVAAYLLDHKNVARVPATLRVEMFANAFHYSDANARPGPKNGSLQAFVDANGPCEDYSPSQFSARDVHRIALFDMRILNSDRNEANILVQRLGSQCKLIPIDHGYALPTQLEISPFDWCWYEWPQLNNHASFPLDEDLRAYILALDIDADVEMLRNRLGISEEALHLLRISSRLVQRGVAAGLRLKRIASLICRHQDESEPSFLEVLIRESDRIARASMGPEFDVLSSRSSPAVDDASSSDSECDFDDAFAVGADDQRPDEGFSSAFRARTDSPQPKLGSRQSNPRNSLVSSAASTSASLLPSRSLISVAELHSSTLLQSLLTSKSATEFSDSFATPASSDIDPKSDTGVRLDSKSVIRQNARDALQEFHRRAFRIISSFIDESIQGYLRLDSENDVLQNRSTIPEKSSSAMASDDADLGFEFEPASQHLGSLPSGSDSLSGRQSASSSLAKPRSLTQPPPKAIAASPFIGFHFQSAADIAELPDLSLDASPSIGSHGARVSALAANGSAGPAKAAVPSKFFRINEDHTDSSDDADSDDDRDDDDDDALSWGSNSDSEAEPQELAVAAKEGNSKHTRVDSAASVATPASAPPMVVASTPTFPSPFSVKSATLLQPSLKSSSPGFSLDHAVSLAPVVRALDHSTAGSSSASAVPAGISDTTSPADTPVFGVSHFGYKPVSNSDWQRSISAFELSPALHAMRPPAVALASVPEIDLWERAQSLVASTSSASSSSTCLPMEPSAISVNTNERSASIHRRSLSSSSATGFGSTPSSAASSMFFGGGGGASSLKSNIMTGQQPFSIKTVIPAISITQPPTILSMTKSSSFLTPVSNPLGASSPSLSMERSLSGPIKSNGNGDFVASSGSASVLGFGKSSIGGAGSFHSPSIHGFSLPPQPPAVMTRQSSNPIPSSGSFSSSVSAPSPLLRPFVASQANSRVVGFNVDAKSTHSSALPSASSFSSSALTASVVGSTTRQSSFTVSQNSNTVAQPLPFGALHAGMTASSSSSSGASREPSSALGKSLLSSSLQQQQHAPQQSDTLERKSTASSTTASPFAASPSGSVGSLPGSLDLPAQDFSLPDSIKNNLASFVRRGSTSGLGRVSTSYDDSPSLPAAMSSFGLSSSVKHSSPGFKVQQSPAGLPIPASTRVVSPVDIPFASVGRDRAMSVSEPPSPLLSSSAPPAAPLGLSGSSAGGGAAKWVPSRVREAIKQQQGQQELGGLAAVSSLTGNAMAAPSEAGCIVASSDEASRSSPIAQMPPSPSLVAASPGKYIPPALRKRLSGMGAPALPSEFALESDSPTEKKMNDAEDCKSPA